MNIWSLGSGVRLISEPVGEVWASTSESRLSSAAVGSWSIIVQAFRKRSSKLNSSLGEENQFLIYIKGVALTSITHEDI